MPTRRDILRPACGLAALALGPGLAKVGGRVNLGTVKGVPVGASGSGWACPAHGSRFATNGSVTNGPAARPLARVRSTFNGRTLVVGCRGPG